MRLIFETLALRNEIQELRVQVEKLLENTKVHTQEPVLVETTVIIDKIDKNSLTGYKLNQQIQEILVIKKVLKMFPSNIKGSRKTQANELGYTIDKYSKKLKKYNLYE